MQEEKALEIFKALGDKTRLKIIKSLYEKTECLEELSEKFGLTPATLSFHMKKLESAGLVTKLREQYFTNFSLTGELYEKKLNEIIELGNSSTKGNDIFKKKVIANFMHRGKITQFPRQHKKRLMLLEEVIKHFKTGKIYKEKEVDKIISEIFSDYCTLRRMLIDEGFMERNNGDYQVKTQEEINESVRLEKQKNQKIASERKRELKLQYKEQKIQMGVYKIENTKNGKIYIGATQNIPGRFNRQQFLLKMGLHLNKELQAEWNEYGKDCFNFEVLEELKEPDESLRFNNLQLAKMKALWLERLQPFEEKGYNKKSAKTSLED